MKRLIPLLCLPAIALPALAQDSGDWDLTRNPDERLVMASATFSSGLALATRCRNGSYQALILGLPPVVGQTRILRVGFRDDPLSDQNWNVATEPQVAISDMPAPFARKLRQGGQLQIIIPDGGGPGRNLRHVLDLPASTTAIDESLSACRRPLVDPRDAELRNIEAGGLPARVEWVQRPTPTFPRDLRYASGFAVISCLVNPDGRMRHCAVETQHPEDGGFGRAALTAAKRGRVRNIDDPTAPLAQSRYLSFRVQFFLAPG